MTKSKNNELSREELVELVDLLLHSIRNARYRELLEKYNNDESLDAIIAKAQENDTERLVVKG